MTVFACVPACKNCKLAGTCADADNVADNVYVSRAAPWAPNDLAYCKLTCGCIGIPWPVIAELGGKNPKILCDSHGMVTVVDERQIRKPNKRQRAKAEFEAANEPIPF